MYDIIGDIHGHADELVSLLELMGYRQRAGGVYEHPSRHAIFVGDFVGLHNSSVNTARRTPISTVRR